MPDLGMSLNQSQKQEQVLSAQMLQRMALLTLPITELQDRIQKEIEENPALEIPDEAISDIRFTNDVPQEKTVSDDPETSSYDDFDGGDYENDIYDSNPNQTSGDFDPEASDRKSAFLENSASHDTTLGSYLMQQLGLTSASPELFDVASQIITSLDSNGFFTQSPETLIENPDQKLLIPQAIDLVQSLDPAGICVPDYKASLILQARRKNIPRSDLEQFSILINEHFDNLKPARFPQIAKKMNTTPEDIEAYYEFLRTLNPFPGSAFASGENSFVVPELSIHREDGKLVLSINKANLPNLELSADFSSLADGLHGEEARQANKFIGDSINRAKLLISQIELRYSTLYKTALVLMDLQKDFFFNGPASLKPLTLKTVAERVGVHETTISRISQAKWIETDWGLMQMKQLFSQGVQTTGDTQEEVSRNVVKQRIEEIVRANTSEKKLSDQKIADMLLEKGIKVARRTVAKYRAELNLDSSFDR